MSHFFADVINGTACLKREDHEHALKSLRLKDGEPITLAVNGMMYAAQFNPQNLYTLASPLPGTEPGVHVTLYQGIPKGDKMETVVQTCTQGGVSRIVPVAFRRCVSQWDPSAARKKTDRLRKIAYEAAMQSVRCVVPEITAPVRPQDIPFDAFDAVFMPWEESARAGGMGLKGFFAKAERPIRTAAIIIGPEGGIDREEAEALIEKGAVPISLGKRIFRTETAGFAALTALMALTGNLEE